MKEKKKIKYVSIRLDPEFYWKLKERAVKNETTIQRYVWKCLADKIWTEEFVENGIKRGIRKC